MLLHGWMTEWATSLVKVAVSSPQWFFGRPTGSNRMKNRVSAQLSEGSLVRGSTCPRFLGLGLGLVEWTLAQVDPRTTDYETMHLSKNVIKICQHSF